MSQEDFPQFSSEHVPNIENIPTNAFDQIMDVVKHYFLKSPVPIRDLVSPLKIISEKNNIDFESVVRAFAIESKRFLTPDRSYVTVQFRGLHQDEIVNILLKDWPNKENN